MDRASYLTMMIQAYSPKIESQILNFYNSLSEKDRRRYAAIEAIKLGYGGVTYTRSILQCDDRTITRGLQELNAELSNESTRIRQSGAGRKLILDTTEGLEDAFLEVIKEHTAGSPMNETIKWTNLSRPEISENIMQKGYAVSVTVVDQLLKKHNFRPRQAFKVEAGKKNIPHRDEQFKNITQFKQDYTEKGLPVLSMDVKKELIGNFYRAGKPYTQDVIRVNDHDFPSLAEGKVTPHGLYDINQNIGYIRLGTSHDTSEFAAECIRLWWLEYGRYEYLGVKSLLLLRDCGGSNNARYYLFKEELQKLSDELNLEIRIAHYPPYTSKYNPIEHLLFPHITRACQGVIFKSVEIVNDLIAKSKTSTGLKVVTNILNKIFETGRKVANDFKDNMRIQFDELLPQWNYTAVPASSVFSGLIKS